MKKKLQEYFSFSFSGMVWYGMVWYGMVWLALVFMRQALDSTPPWG